MNTVDTTAGAMSPMSISAAPRFPGTKIAGIQKIHVKRYVNPKNNTGLYLCVLVFCAVILFSSLIDGLVFCVGFKLGFCIGLGLFIIFDYQSVLIVLYFPFQSMSIVFSTFSRFFLKTYFAFFCKYYNEKKRIFVFYKYSFFQRLDCSYTLIKTS